MNTKKKDETKRVLVKADIRKNEELEAKINQAIRYINGPIKNALINIGFDASQDNLKDCMLNSGDRIVEEYNNKKDLDLEKIATPAIRNSFDASAGLALLKFQETAIGGLHSYRDVLNYISFDEDQAVLSDEAKNKLIEDHSMYLTDPDEIELFELHKKVAEALNNFLQGYKTNELMDWFEYGDDGKVQPLPLNYTWVLSRIKNNKKEDVKNGI